MINGADCAPGDADAWTAPSPSHRLELTKDDDGFTWSQPVSGSGAVYDVMRSLDHTDFWNATCVASGVRSARRPGATPTPAPGELFFYQVRARSACGMSTLGNYPDGTHATARPATRAPAIADFGRRQ